MVTNWTESFFEYDGLSQSSQRLYVRAYVDGCCGEDTPPDADRSVCLKGRTGIADHALISPRPYMTTTLVGFELALDSSDSFIPEPTPQIQVTEALRHCTSTTVANAVPFLNQPLVPAVVAGAEADSRYE